LETYLGSRGHGVCCDVVRIVRISNTRAHSQPNSACLPPTENSSDVLALKRHNSIQIKDVSEESRKDIVSPWIHTMSGIYCDF
jgi:hypothetical protein